MTLRRDWEVWRFARWDIFQHLLSRLRMVSVTGDVALRRTPSRASTCRGDLLPLLLSTKTTISINILPPHAHAALIRALLFFPLRGWASLFPSFPTRVPAFHATFRPLSSYGKRDGAFLCPTRALRTRWMHARYLLLPSRFYRRHSRGFIQTVHHAFSQRSQALLISKQHDALLRFL